MLNPVRWPWRVKLLVALGIFAPWLAVWEEPTNRLPSILAWIAVATAYAALAWRARAEPDADGGFDAFLVACFLVTALYAVFWDGTGWMRRGPSSHGGRLASVALGVMLGMAWRVRRQARRAAQASG